MTLITRLGAAFILLAADSTFWTAVSPTVALPSRHRRPRKATTAPPPTHYWSTDKGCCVPRAPKPPTSPPPQCRDGWTWYPGLHMCLPSTPHPPPPTPSGGHGWKRHAHKRAPRLCPAGLDACPIPGVASNDYECIDTHAELESCGGCASLGQGQDCTAITGAWNVGCEQGRCAVYTCTFGFKRSPDGQSCIPV
ncbi:hypothetical protein C8J57DRAFT_1269424 [Mycena rebaudengoi]|nr:hypothetical protein C8J57DRAFT_1269424 [Mycena rebaudengoi]